MSAATNQAATLKTIAPNGCGAPGALQFRHIAGPLRSRNPVRVLTRRLHPTASGEGEPMSNLRVRGPRLPPRWFIRLAWSTHRALYRATRGRVGLWRPRTGRWGTLRLTTIGRRTGQDRSVLIAYLVDGPNLITMAMNGWADSEPAWWLNLQAHPAAKVDLPGGPRTVQARAAEGQERSRLWERWREVDPKLDDYAAMRSSQTVIVILEPGPIHQQHPAPRFINPPVHQH